MSKFLRQNRKFWVRPALALALLCLGVSARAEPGVYNIDPKQSGFLVNTGVSGLLKSFGRPLTIEVLNYSGSIRFNPQEPRLGSVKVEIEAYSLALKTQATERDRMNIEMRMHEKVLQSEQYPAIEYQSDKIQVWKTGEGRYDADIQGNLTLHGITRFFPIRATLHVKGNRIEASGEIPLSQKEFKIKPYAYEGGALRVADQVKVTFNFVATR